MLPQYKKSTNIEVGLGIVAQVIGQILTSNGNGIVGSIILLAGLAALI